MEEEIENELDKVKLKYSDADVDEVLTKLFNNSEYLFIKDVIIDAIKNHYISKMEMEYSEH
jgi:hypothetical protein